MNIGGIILAVIAYIILGMFWYSPVLFGNVWMKVTGVNPEKTDKEKMNLIYGISALAALITASVLDYLQLQFDVQSISQAFFLGFVLWFGFTFTSTMVNNMYQGKQKALTIIDAGYQLTTVLVMSIILYFL